MPSSRESVVLRYDRDNIVYYLLQGMRGLFGVARKDSGNVAVALFAQSDHITFLENELAYEDLCELLMNSYEEVRTGKSIRPKRITVYREAGNIVIEGLVSGLSVTGKKSKTLRVVISDTQLEELFEYIKKDGLHK
ncbi:hypothetical protein LRY65_05735 [Candidatus Woesebacteria bacterium]|nr:hypothetical protein [Candidatus Woesebacteria bacterium]MCD8506760.1 hypothetical protein [Candidatus Woesebacteria bacterium]MCD8527667.1 hypothetical protein [Candidatus Woesebacteria bacterium]MCD8546363.1 hypothetical protein [Candidatus Woesebacteria bacterium]